MTDQKPKPREWTLCYGEYEDPAWNGPLFDGKIHVIEASYARKLEKQVEVMREALKYYEDMDTAVDRKHYTYKGHIAETALKKCEELENE